MARQAGRVMSLDAIRKRLSAGENVSTEFVSDVNSAAEIGKAVCACLNTDGGQVYCGVDDAGHILGIKPNVEMRAQRLERELKDLISPTTLFSAEVAVVDDQPLI